MSERDVTVIIPAYNEEDRIGKTLRDLIDNMDTLARVIVVVDGNDRTEEIARSFGPMVQVYRDAKRLGKGGAVLKGLELAETEKICFTDADGSTPWYEVKRLTDMLGRGMEMIVGSRWMRDSRVKKKEPLLNIIAGRMFHYLNFLILGIRVKDTQCGMKCMTRDLAKELVKRVAVRDRTFDVSLIYNAMLLGATVREVGIEWTHDENTRMPILHAVPFMLAAIVAMRLSHGRRSERIGPLLMRVYRNFRFY
ncbi:dolichyl-phosphate mannose synthase [Thermogymnomonas acidicola]|uniref:Dolichyl-phosphate mannose synthase n=1 Tax=Thermogymnomonas acidicola TaxID=399579 RepID=A0AA37FAI1_9ARCH|nr:glycosyltransferase [Thermogymnomonas acidicola]GGM79194.1 dolichyl-phosphate mannose synthase [Thermogymnomonas acidicola]